MGFPEILGGFLCCPLGCSTSVVAYHWYRWGNLGLVKVYGFKNHGFESPNQSKALEETLKLHQPSAPRLGSRLFVFSSLRQARNLQGCLKLDEGKGVLVSQVLDVKNFSISQVRVLQGQTYGRFFSGPGSACRPLNWDTQQGPPTLSLEA